MAKTRHADAESTTALIEPASLAPYVHEVTTALARLAQQSGLAELAYFLEMTALVASEQAQQHGS